MLMKGLKEVSVSGNGWQRFIDYYIDHIIFSVGSFLGGGDGFFISQPDQAEKPGA